MPFSYNKLLKLMIDRKISKGDLQKAIDVSPTTIAKLSNGGNVSLDVLDKICNYLDCEIEDIIEHIKN